MGQQKDVVLGNAIVWAGSNLKQMQGGLCIRDGKVQKIFHQETAQGELSTDLGGMHIIPGLIDAHSHFFIAAMLPLGGDASAWTSRHDALEAIEAACRSNGSDKRWVFFSGLDNARWRSSSLPRIHEIDRVSLGSPVLVVDTTCHRGLVSTEALRRTRISRDTLRMPGDIDIHLNGTPKGTVWEDALTRVLFTMFREKLQTFSDEEKVKLLLTEADKCLHKGLTHVNDPGLPSDIQRLLREAQKDTPLKLSWCVTAFEGLCAPPELRDELDSICSEHAPKSVKFFLDGANRAAASMPAISGLKASFRAAMDSLSQKNLSPLSLLFEQKNTLKGKKIHMPYLRFKDPAELIRRASLFTEKGYRLVMHALGNVAASQAAQVVKDLGVGSSASIEHVLIMDKEGLDPFASCGAVASIQPGFIPYYAETIEKRGILPYLKAFPLRSLSERGVRICISSDGPCGADDPLHNIRRAVDRKKADGSVFDPDERISQVQAMAAGTFGGSSSLGLKNDGLIEGAPATFCVVDKDPFSDMSRVVQTWIDGKRVY
ncbi:MAG: amidohydrolase family protein [Proteobacteria bacterium]|nr:amidohydrolase family protein [Desulfobacula sp.]MBU3952212.1 amidohydrolase family protein [Pseudomonadota bacterium]MBU4133344.1 amidohydrolase family protein [Pseudomonadota bacterium]